MSRYHKKFHFKSLDFLKIGLISSLITVIVVGACLSLVLLAYLSFLGMLVKNDKVMSLASVDGKYQAVAFLRCEGAWGGCTPEVSILNSDATLPNTDANIFIGSYHSGFIDILWVGERSLLVRYELRIDNPLSLQVHQYGDIQIEYELVESDQQ